MKLSVLFFLGASCFLTACNSDQAHLSRHAKIWQWHDLWEPGPIYDDHYHNVVGLVDDDGYLYDTLRNRLGRIETIGTIKRHNQIIGYIHNHLDVYNAQHQLIGNVDRQGYIIDRDDKLNGRLHERDFSASSIDFGDHPGVPRTPGSHRGTLEYSDIVFNQDNKEVGTITFIPQETDYQAIPIAHPDDRMIAVRRPYAALLLLDYDKAAVQHKEERAKYAYLCKRAYLKNKRDIYNNRNELIGYMDRRDGFTDRNVYDLKHDYIGFISYGGTDMNYTDINIYDERDRAVGRVPFGFEESAARMLLDGINNMHVPWDGFEECDGGSISPDNDIYDIYDNKIGHLDQNSTVLDLQNRIAGHIGPKGTLFDENNKLIAKPAGGKGAALETYKGAISQFEAAHKILMTYQYHQREIADQKAREEQARAREAAAKQAREQKGKAQNAGQVEKKSPKKNSSDNNSSHNNSQARKSQAQK